MGQKLARGEMSGRSEIAGRAEISDQMSQDRAAGGPSDELWPEASTMSWPVLGRTKWALWLNVFVPGAGLIALQRMAAGVAVLVGFAPLAQVAVLGLFIMPGTIGMPVTTFATIGAVLAWLIVQLLLFRRLRELQDSDRQLRACSLIGEAREDVLVGRWASAKRALEEAATFDDEQPELNWLLAQIMTATSRSSLAKKQWRRLQQVDKVGRHSSHVEEALLHGVVDGQERAAR